MDFLDSYYFQVFHGVVWPTETCRNRPPPPPQCQSGVRSSVYGGRSRSLRHTAVRISCMKLDTLNNFSFNEEHYLQIQGTAMGTRMAPSYANLFMAKLEQDLARPHTWWRYIDDIFAIWQHGRESLTTFLEQINSFHPSIKFTAETSTQQVEYKRPVFGHYQ